MLAQVARYKLAGLDLKKAIQTAVRFNPRFFSIKSADEYFFPNLFASPSTKPTTKLPSHIAPAKLSDDDEVAGYERDILLLDHGTYAHKNSTDKL